MPGRGEEMRITIRAIDAATKTIGLVKTGITTLAKSGIKSMADLGKQFLGFKSILVGLVGGGLLAKFVSDLAKGAKKFEATFSPQAQERLDNLGTGINKLGATFKATIGAILAENSEAIVNTLNKISKWLIDNQDKIVDFFRAIGQIIGSVMINLESAIRSVIRIFSYANNLVQNVRTLLRGGRLDPVKLRPEVQEKYDKAVQDGTIKISENSDEAFAEKDRLEAERWKLIKAQVAGIKEIEIASEAAIPSVGKLDEELLTVRETLSEIEILVSERFASGITDAFFEIIEGTKSVGQAFADMISSILKDFGRLALQQGLFNLFTGLFSGGASIPGGSSYGSTAFGSLLPRASGGPTSAGGTYLVGENGPEVLRMGPRGGRVDNSGGMGGIVINQTINGGDPGEIARATKSAVYQALESDPRFRSRMRSAIA